MNVYHAKDLESELARAHPWSEAEADSTQRYYDFKQSPELIPSVLEDFQEFSSYRSVQQFYALLAWLNVESALESNDCAFRGPSPNTTDRQFPFPIKCSGRLMVLFKNLEENAQEKSINWLCTALQAGLMAASPSFKAGAVGLSRMAVAYKALGSLPGQAGLGKEVMLSFWAYGDSAGVAMESLGVVVAAMESALRAVDAQIASGALDALYE